ncbi:response regulator [Sulfurimonas sp.]|nr:response regulator [Sulfurimonas sp.]
MNILIVDDNKNNRMILRLLLEDYMEENKEVSFSLDEAEDGQVAVNKCREGNFELILMDIMMPNMDGIEATRIIRAEYPKTMIIAVSAVDDSERKKLILNNGAEDYIAKPVNADIFISRMSNYLALSESRATKKTHSETVANLFTKDVYSRHTRFLITSEDSLSEFWEYYLLSSDIKSDGLSDVIRTVFAIAEIQRRLDIKSDIFVEDAEDKKYFTLSNIENVPSKIILLTLKKNNFLGKYKMENGKISFELEIVFSDLEQIVHESIQPIANQTAVTPKAKLVDAVKQTPVVEEVTAVDADINVQSSLALEVFDYMDQDDLFDLEEYAAKLSSIMLLVGGGGVTEDEVVDIYTYLDKIGSVLATYSEIYPISKALGELSLDMSSHMQEFIDNSEALGPMCKAFSVDMTNWIEKSFHTGAPSVDFMNDTIVVNCQTIGGMLKMDEAPIDGGDDFDDIFDF